MLRFRNSFKPAVADKSAVEENASMSDARLVQKVRHGDKRAFVEIVARHQAMVCGIALGILGDFAASEDAAQEAFLTAWRKFNDLREPEHLRSWLGQIARNTALGQLRRKRGAVELEEALSFPDASPLPDEVVAGEEEAAIVRRCLGQLPENYRLPLVLYYREGQSVRVVAEALGLTEDAVKQRLARGREMLREQMSGLVENVLKRTGPNAVFTMTIAVAIGALAAPAKVAGAALTASSAAGSASGGAASPILAAMSSSKIALVTAALLAVVSIPIGYQVASIQRSLPRATFSGGKEAGKTPRQSGPDFKDSVLLAEWRYLHEVYGATAASMPKLYQAINELQDRFRRQAFGAALVAEWARVDPTNGFAFFLAKGRDTEQRRQFPEEWLAVDANRAVAALLASNSGWEEMARDCLKEIAKRAPSRLADVVARLPKADNYWDTNVRDAFAILAEGNLAGARTVAEAMAGPNREQALSGVALAWAKQDFAAAIAWARGLPEGTDRNEVLRGTLLGRAAVDPAGALESVELVPAGGRHAYFADTTGARVLGEAANTDFNSAVAWLTAHPGRFGREDLFGLSREVTDRLNADAAGFLSAHANDGSLAVLMPALEHALLNNGAGQRAVVWEWLKSQPENETTAALKREVLSSSAFQDPDLALTFVADLPQTPEGQAQLKELARCLLNGGMALDRFDRLMANAPERLRQPLMQAAFENLRSDFPLDPQTWVARLPQLSAIELPKATESLGRAWAAQAPEDAIAWAGSLGQAEARTSAEAAIVATWAGKAPQDATEWVSSLPAGAERDSSVNSLVQAIAQQFPQEAWELAVTIGDAAKRVQAATQAIKMMAARAPTIAHQWIESGPFDTQTRAALLAAIDQPHK